MTRAMIYLSHIASQMIYKWIDPFSSSDDRRSTQGNFRELFSMTASEFRDEIIDTYGLPRPSMPWLDYYLKSKKGSVAALVKTAINHIEFCKKFDARIILISDPEYPPLLRMIKDPPIAITVKGDLSILDLPKVAIIGSRRACTKATKESFALGKLLSECGFAVVSGGAYGCDISAHHGVIESSVRPAPAVLVFAGGLSNLYPRGNLKVFKELNQRNAIFLSERLWDCPSLPRDFPVRNRIVSGLARETIVVQAGVRSGAMITARLALDQGRDVSVLHFEYDDLAADGNLELMSQGAQSFSQASDWLDRVCDYKQLIEEFPINAIDDSFDEKISKENTSINSCNYSTIQDSINL